MLKEALTTAANSVYGAVNAKNCGLDSIKGRSSMESLLEKYGQGKIQPWFSSHLMKSDEPTNDGAVCRPWNYQDYLARLHSFHHSSDWFAKPDCISPPECALRGWKNSGRDKLICNTCRSSVEHRKDDVDGSSLLAALIDGHEESCGWRLLSCDKSFLDLQEMHPLELNRQTLSRVRESLVNIDKHDKPIRAAVHCHKASSMDWIPYLHPVNDTDTFILEFQSPGLLNHTLSSVVAVMHSMTSKSTSGSVKGSLIELLAQETQTEASRQSLVVMLLLSVHGWTIQPLSYSSGSTTEQKKQQHKLCACCSLCNRKVPLDNGSTSERCFDVVTQHKPYCSYVRPQQTCSSSSSSAGNDSDTVSLGKASVSLTGSELIVAAMTQIKEYPLKNATTTTTTTATAAPTVVNSTSTALPVSSATSESAEQSYKRIRLVLNSSV